jgi:hypothetical protein
MIKNAGNLLWGRGTKYWTNRCRTEQEMQRRREEKKKEKCSVKGRKNEKESRK